MTAKTAGVAKTRVQYLVGNKEVKPMRVNGRMLWCSDDGTIRAKTWESRKVTISGGK